MSKNGGNRWRVELNTPFYELYIYSSPLYGLHQRPPWSLPRYKTKTCYWISRQHSTLAFLPLLLPPISQPFIYNPVQSKYLDTEISFFFSITSSNDWLFNSSKLLALSFFYKHPKIKIYIFTRKMSSISSNSFAFFLLLIL